MNNLRDKDCIHNITIAMIRINFYLDGMTELEFNKDIKTQDAVSYCLLKLATQIKELPNRIKDSLSGFILIFGAFQEIKNFTEDDLWDVLKNEDIGLLKHTNLIYEFYDTEVNGVLKDKTKRKGEKIKVPEIEYTWDYKYPTKTKSSIWPVKK